MKDEFYPLSDLIDGLCTQDEYYGQFVTDQMQRLIMERFNMTFLRDSYCRNSSFSTIQIKYWDEILSRYMSKVNRSELDESLRLRGDYYTTGGMILVVKQAAKQLVESWGK